MEIPVLVVPLSDGGFRARVADLLALTAEGETLVAALRQLRDPIATRTASGTILTSNQSANPTSRSGPHLIGGFSGKRPSSIVGRGRPGAIASRLTTTRTDHEPLRSRHRYALALPARSARTRVEGQPPHDLAMTVVTVKEQLKGW